MDEKATAMVMASFAADSLSLGVHWIYDTDVIDNDFGRVERFLKPRKGSYHLTKDKGEFTHYGDQTLVLLESVAKRGGFDIEDFSRRWQEFFGVYKGYFDHATKETLKKISEGMGPTASGSMSTDLGGASRIAPLVYRYRQNEEAGVTSARAQTAMTHNHPQVIDSAEFFARVSFLVLDGASPLEAIKKSLPEGGLKPKITAGIESASQDTRSTIKAFGQMCDISVALPGVIHLIAKYENDLQQAMVENVMAGGDSAARGLLVGMVLGAHLGPQGLPANWQAELKCGPEIAEILKDIDNQL